MGIETTTLHTRGGGVRMAEALARLKRGLGTCICGRRATRLLRVGGTSTTRCATCARTGHATTDADRLARLRRAQSGSDGDRVRRWQSLARQHRRDAAVGRFLRVGLRSPA